MLDHSGTSVADKYQSPQIVVAQKHHAVSFIWINTASDRISLPDYTNPLIDAKWYYHHYMMLRNSLQSVWCLLKYGSMTD